MPLHKFTDRTAKPLFPLHPDGKNRHISGANCGTRVAHKLIRTIYFMLTRRQAYHDSGIDYAAANVAKNAPRWLKALKRFGYWPETSAA